MAPSAIEAPLELQALPLPRTYAPREAHFEGFIVPQTDGYRNAKAQPSDRVAVVIDNGIEQFACSLLREKMITASVYMLTLQ